MKTRGTCVALACAFLGVSTTSSPARADATETDGERLFREGRALMLEGRFDEACPKLAESQALDPHVGTLLNLAACHERQGKVGSAWVEYEKALTAARAEGQSERAKLAQERITALEPRVPWLTVSVAGSLADGASEDVTVTLDGGVIQRVALGKEMPVDPGEHVVQARRESRKPFEQRFEMREAEHRTITLAELAEPAPKEPEARIVVDPNPPATSAPADASKSGRWLFEPGVVVGYLSVGRSARAADLSSFEVSTGNGTTSRCSSVSCSFSGDRNGGVVGINVFAGYAISERSHLGARLLTGPVTEGGYVVAFGPSISFQATGALWLGAWGFLGAATVSSSGYVTSAGGSSTGRVEVTWSAGGIGAGLEARLDLLTLAHGRLFANVTPFFIVGDGTAWSLPVGVAYQFQ